MNTYRPTSEWAIANYGDEPVELDLDAAAEGDLVPKHMQLVPRSYRVLSDNYAAGEQDSTVELALPVDHEAALIAGGHLERVEEDPKPRTRRRRNQPKKAQEE